MHFAYGKITYGLNSLLAIKIDNWVSRFDNKNLASKNYDVDTIKRDK